MAEPPSPSLLCISGGVDCSGMLFATLYNPGLRALQAASYFDPTFSTQEACIAFCDARGYTFAGAEFGRECCVYRFTWRDVLDRFIPNIRLRRRAPNNSTQQASTDCNIACPFDAGEACGGSDRLSLFSKIQGPTLVMEFSGALPGVWNYVGSFNNTTSNSEPFNVKAVIANTATTSGSVKNCLTWCSQEMGCPLCSISDGGFSECGNTLSPNRVPSVAAGCVPEEFL
ncbi:hypothetical protein K439DRAFT_1660374 [Ramaria rubella]|nr:hypothetical protein K439DRAFT_1660374 [Ramaria rubella]